jgi:hypothetical protein
MGGVMRLKARTVFFIVVGSCSGLIPSTLTFLAWGCLGGLWADHVVGVLGEYPLLR